MGGIISREQASESSAESPSLTSDYLTALGHISRSIKIHPFSGPPLTRGGPPANTYSFEPDEYTPEEMAAFRRLRERGISETAVNYSAGSAWVGLLLFSLFIAHRLSN